MWMRHAARALWVNVEASAKCNMQRTILNHRNLPPPGVSPFWHVLVWRGGSKRTCPSKNPTHLRCAGFHGGISSSRLFKPKHDKKKTPPEGGDFLRLIGEERRARGLHVVFWYLHTHVESYPVVKIISSSICIYTQLHIHTLCTYLAFWGFSSKSMYMWLCVYIYIELGIICIYTQPHIQTLCTHLAYWGFSCKSVYVCLCIHICIELDITYRTG